MSLTRGQARVRRANATNLHRRLIDRLNLRIFFAEKEVVTNVTQAMSRVCDKFPPILYIKKKKPNKHKQEETMCEITWSAFVYHRRQRREVSRPSTYIYTYIRVISTLYARSRESKDRTGSSIAKQGNDTEKTCRLALPTSTHRPFHDSPEKPMREYVAHIYDPRCIRRREIPEAGRGANKKRAIETIKILETIAFFFFFNTSPLFARYTFDDRRISSLWFLRNYTITI